MADNPYLVCLALIEQNGQRRLPLGGKGLQQSIAAGCDPGAEGHALALDLLLPQLKQAWLRTGDTEALMNGLRQLTAQGWTLATAKFSQPTFACW